MLDVVQLTSTVRAARWALPAGWEWIALEELCLVITGGGTPPRGEPKYFGGDVVWITPTDLDIEDPCRVITESSTTLTQLGLQNSSAKLLPAGAVLFSSRATIGKLAIAGVPLATNQGFVNFVCGDRLHNRYLGWALRALTEEIKKLAGSTTYQEVSRGNLRHFRVPVPFPDAPAYSLDIQRRIVARIEALLAEVKEARALAAAIWDDTERVMDAAANEAMAALSGSRRPLIEVLEGKPRNGWSPQCDNDPSGTPVLKLGAVLGFRFNQEAVKYTSLPVDRDAHYWLTSGDILISRSNTPDLVGHAAVYRGQPHPCIYPDLLMRMRAKHPEADSQFVVYWLRSREARDYVAARASGASSTMKKITQGHVCQLPFPALGPAEQRAIAAHLDAVQTELEEMTRLQHQDAELLDQVEQSILDRAFRGEL